MKRFDINACFGHWPYWDLHHKTVGDLVASMDRNNIDQAAVMSLRGLLLDWRAGNEETLAAATRYPTRLVPIATLSPFLDGDGKELARLADLGMRGVRLYPTFHNYPLSSSFVDEVCQAASDGNIPVMLPTRPMMNWRFTAVPIETCGAVIERHPATTFILSGPNYLVEFQAVVQLMAQCPNVAFDISCLQGFGSIAKLVGHVGADRVLFGTGAVLNYPACNVAKLDHAEITEHERSAVASENAMKMLRLRG
ncbi:MAG: amidohydrolase family protein [Pirellulales bacterium]